jgi:hypothetical protein
MTRRGLEPGTASGPPAAAAAINVGPESHSAYHRRNLAPDSQITDSNTESRAYMGPTLLMYSSVECSTCLICKITVNLFQVPREQASSSSSSLPVVAVTVQWSVPGPYSDYDTPEYSPSLSLIQVLGGTTRTPDSESVIRGPKAATAQDRARTHRVSP